MQGQRGFSMLQIPPRPRFAAFCVQAMEEDPQISEEEAEDREWIESLEYVIENSGRERASELLRKLRIYSQRKGVRIPYTSNTPYVNTIALEDQPRYPGDYEIERNIRSIIRWNAMAMVVRANRIDDGIGGHISTYASAATLYEIGFQHFFRAGDERWGRGHDLLPGTRLSGHIRKSVS